MKKYLFFIILAVLVCAAPLSAMADTPAAGDANGQGIDIYEGDSDNGQIDWPMVSQSQSFVWIKISEGEHYEDSMYPNNIAGAKAAGIAWGPYQFLRLYSPESCARQADNFWSRIAGTGYTVFPAVDVESYDNCETSEEVRACVRAFVDEFRANAGYTPILYTYTSYAVNNDLSDFFPDCKLWQADYRGYTGETGFPLWAAWQYSDSGTIDGIQNHSVDLDRATDEIFLGPVSSQPSVPTSGDSGSHSGFYAASQLDGPINSRAGADFEVLDRDGNRVPGREVSKDDPLIILSVDYDSQLAEIEYPVYSENGWYHGWIANNESLLHNIGYNKWLNGSSPEPVYDKAGSLIGMIDPQERATILYRADDGRTCVLYGTGKGSEAKSGYVWYEGLS